MPAEFNWLDIADMRHPARDQAQCGSCWAFSAIGALEMQSVLEGNKYVALSPEQAIDWFVKFFYILFTHYVVEDIKKCVIFKTALS